MRIPDLRIIDTLLIGIFFYSTEYRTGQAIARQDTATTRERLLTAPVSSEISEARLVPTT